MVTLEQFTEWFWFFGILLIGIITAAYVGLFSSIEAIESDFPKGIFIYKDV